MKEEGKVPPSKHPVSFLISVKPFFTPPSLVFATQQRVPFSAVGLAGNCVGVCHRGGSSTTRQLASWLLVNQPI